MAMGWYQHEDFLKHDTGAHHPERADRLRAVAGALEKAALVPKLTALSPDPIELEKLHGVHDAAYVQRVVEACAGGPQHLDGDTVVVPASGVAARRGCGAAVDACDRVLEGALTRAFCTPRPPGHHAERDRAMGFCLFNHVAVAADHLVRRHGLKRVAIVDFDVHHGNGTQHAFEDRADVLFVSIHQDPATLYPGTGYAHERGRGAGEGFTLNVPMPPGGGDDAYRDAFEQTVVPRLDRFKPEFLLISAGFDAAKEDPLAQMELTADAFAWMTEQLVAVARRHAGGRIVSTLEGGYHLEALGRGAVAHVEALLA